MKWFSLFAAALVISCSTAHADPLARFSAVQPSPASPPGYVLPAGTGVDRDYPAYPAGFSSYRGLGFMGSCGERVSPCAQRAWDGYCDQKACCEPTTGPSFCEKLRGWLSRPEWSCSPNSCNSCGGGPGANWWPVPPSCGEPLSCKLQRLRAKCAGILGGCRAGACGDPGCEGGKGSEPAKAETLESVEPLPEPAASEAPAPQTTSGIVPNVPSPPSLDRSASRSDLRRLPRVGGSY